MIPAYAKNALAEYLNLTKIFRSKLIIFCSSDFEDLVQNILIPPDASFLGSFSSLQYDSFLNNHSLVYIARSTFLD